MIHKGALLIIFWRVLVTSAAMVIMAYTFVGRSILERFTLFDKNTAEKSPAGGVVRMNFDFRFRS